MFGVQPITITGNYTLATIGDDTTSESRKAAYVLTGAPGADFEFVMSAGIVRPLIVLNQTNKIATVKFASGAPDVVTVEPGACKALVAAAGSGVYETAGVDYLTAFTNVGFLNWKRSTEYWHLAAQVQPTKPFSVAWRTQAISAGMLTVDWSNGLQIYVTLDQSITSWSFVYPVTGGYWPVTLRFHQAVLAGRTISWSGAFRFANGARPVMTPTLGAVDVLKGILDASGNIFVSSYKQDYTV